MTRWLRGLQKVIAVNTGNVFRFNTVQIPWRANCFAIYGGKDNRIEDNLCYDVVTYPGILIAQQFNSNPFEGEYFCATQFIDPRGRTDVPSRTWCVEDLLRARRDSRLDRQRYFDRLSHLQRDRIAGQLSDYFSTIEHISVQSAGTSGIHLSSNLKGDVTFSFVVVTDSGKEAFTNYAPKLKFQLIPGDGNSGW